MKPTKKVTTAALVGSATILLVYALNRYLGMDLGPTEAQALTVLLSAFAAYMKEDG